MMADTRRTVPAVDLSCPTCGCCAARMCAMAREQETTCAEIQPIFASITDGCPCPRMVPTAPPMLMIVGREPGDDDEPGRPRNAGAPLFGPVPTQRP